MERRNVTIGGNVTEVQEFVTYDITQLRMDPDYIRSQIYTLYIYTTYTTRVGIIGLYISEKFPRGSQVKSRGLLGFPLGLGVQNSRPREISQALGWISQNLARNGWTRIQ